MSGSRPFYAAYAAAYDLLVTDPVEGWVEAVHERLVGAGWPRALVLDAGCGTGRHAAALAARGHRVDLADASEELLAHAARRMPAARRLRVDLCDFEVGRSYEAVTCRGVLNDMVGDGERDGVLRSLAGSLREGGMLLLDVREERASRERADGIPRRRTVGLGAGRHLAFTSTVVWDAGVLRVSEQYDVRTGDGLVRSSCYDFVMRPWSEGELRRRLRRAGFSRVEVAAGVGRRASDRLFVTAT